MRAAIQTGIRQIEVKDVERPRVLPGTAVVRVEAVGICGSDLHTYADRAQPQSAPEGHEFSGVVVEVSEGLSSVRVGERVAVDNCASGLGCGACDYCRAGAHVLCQGQKLPFGGGYAEYARVGANGFYRLPDSVDLKLGALAEPLAVGVHGVRHARIPQGASVVILGAGTIGLMALFAARALVGERVYITAKHPFQAEAARRLGAAEVLPVEPEAALAAVRELTGGGGADYVLEAVGGSTQGTVNLAIEMVRPQGQLVILGSFHLHRAEVDFYRALEKELSLVFPLCYAVIDGRHDFEVAIDLIARQPRTFSSLITHEFPLSEAARAFEVAADKSSQSIKVLLRP